MLRTTPDDVILAPLAIIRNYNDLVLALRARKVALGVSDEALEAVAGLCRGHVSKCLGPSRERGIGAATLERLIHVLAVNLIMVEAPEKLVEMRQHYEQRQESRVRRDNGRISKEAAIKIAWSHVLAKAARRAVNARWKRSTPEERKAISDRMHAAKAAKRALRTVTRKAA